MAHGRLDTPNEREGPVVSLAAPVPPPEGAAPRGRHGRLEPDAPAAATTPSPAETLRTFDDRLDRILRTFDDRLDSLGCGVQSLEDRAENYRTRFEQLEEQLENLTIEVRTVIEDLIGRVAALELGPVESVPEGEAPPPASSSSSSAPSKPSGGGPRNRG